MNRKVIMGCFLVGMILSGHTQEKGFPLRILVGNQATAVPYTSFWSNPIHPSFQIGTEFGYKNHRPNYLYQTVNTGYIYHGNLFQGAYLNTELGYDHLLGFGLNLKALLGIGYLHTFAVNEEYQFKNGRYFSRKDVGNSRVMPSLSLGMGFRTNSDNYTSPEVMLLYQSWLEFPYSPGFSSLMSHTNLSLGLKFFIN